MFGWILSFSEWSPPTGPYREGSQQLWNHKHFEETFNIVSLTGHRLGLQVQGHLFRVNAKAFREGHMLGRNEQYSLLAKFYNAAIEPSIRDGFFAMEWLSTGVPVVRFYRPVAPEEGQNANTTFAPDLNNVNLVRTAKEPPFQSDGCQVVPSVIDAGVWNPRIIKENYRMLPEEVRDSSEHAANYLAAEEAEIVAWMKRRHDIQERLTQAQMTLDPPPESETLRIQTEGVNGTIRVEWAFKKEHDRSGCRVVAYRATGGFGPDHSETGNGQRVIDRDRAGCETHQLERGREYFYTFLVKQKPESPGLLSSLLSNQPQPAEVIIDQLRFQVRVPTEAEEQKAVDEGLKLDDFKKRVRNLITPKAKTEDKKIQKLKEDVASKKRMEEIINQQEKQVVAEIEASDASLEQKAERKEAWETYFEQQKMELFGVE